VKDEYRPWKYSDRGELEFRQQIVGMRSERYKLLFNPGPTDGSIEPDDAGYVLIDMKQDPQENENLSRQNPALREEMQQQLEDWHADAFYDDHSFEMPVFQISGEPSSSSEILAYAPHEVGPDVSNASNYITGFASPEDFARYRVNVRKDGSYDVKIGYDWKGTRPLKVSFDLAGELRNITLPPGGKTVMVSKVPLVRGIQDWKIIPENGSHRLKLFGFSCRIHDP
jgi:hypothetical protein